MKIKRSVSKSSADRGLKSAFALLILAMSGSAVAAPPAWLEKTVDPSVTVTTPNGEKKTYNTGCASEDPTTTDFRYRYFIQQGTGNNGNNLLILLNGGGACWDANTCGLNDPKSITFIRAIFQKTTDNGRLVDCPPAYGGNCVSFETGVLDDANNKNPFQGYTKVFVPYCTGDIFWGNNDPSYNGVITHHRGYGNLLAVLESLWKPKDPNNKGGQGYGNIPPGKIVIAGTSAGAYGAIAAFTEVENRLPQNNQRKTLTYLIADSGNGIVTDGFLNKAVTGSPSKWWGGVENATLPDYVLADLQQGAAGLSVRIYGDLEWRYPRSRFAQFQTAYDAVQVGFLYTMKSVDALYAIPQLPLPNLSLTLAEWTTRMRTAVNLTAAAPTYRFYTAAGYNHTALTLTTAAQQGGPVGSNDFYSVATANIPLSGWVDDMLNKPLWKWQNVTCFPNCSPIPSL